jgi:hypothetical protein
MVRSDRITTDHVSEAASPIPFAGGCGWARLTETPTGFSAQTSGSAGLTWQ